MTARPPRSPWDEAGSGESTALPLGLYAVRVELADVITDDELRADLAANPFHRLLELQPRFGQAPAGRVTLDLTVTGPDVWTTTLTTMAVLRQSGYDLHALHVVTQEARDQRSAA